MTKREETWLVRAALTVAVFYAVLIFIAWLGSNS